MRRRNYLSNQLIIACIVFVNRLFYTQNQFESATESTHQHPHTHLHPYVMVCVRLVCDTFRWNASDMVDYTIFFLFSLSAPFHNDKLPIELKKSQNPIKAMALSLIKLNWSRKWIQNRSSLQHCQFSYLRRISYGFISLTQHVEFWHANRLSFIFVLFFLSVSLYLLLFVFLGGKLTRIAWSTVNDRYSVIMGLHDDRH